jgi:hypothetical protein
MRGPDEALRLAVDALGGDKAVGSALRPEMNPVLAGQWVSHCLDPERREKFSAAQIVFVLTRAKGKGRHEAFESFAQQCGYRVVAVLDPNEEIAELARRAEAAARLSTELSQEMLARMQHAHIKVEP